MRYLIFKHWTDETYMTDKIEKSHLLDLKDKRMEALFDLNNGTSFDAEKNEWIEIKTK